jgi:hypothetical protein
MLVARIAGLAAPLCLVAALAVPPHGASAQGTDSSSSVPTLGEEQPIVVAAKGDRGRSSGARVRARAIAPRRGSVVRSRPSGIRPQQRLVVPRRASPKFVAPRRPSVPYLAKRRAPSVAVPGRRVTPKWVAPKGATPLPRLRFQATRKAPASLALINSGLHGNPGRNKPAGIEHYQDHKAGKSGWIHRYRPFVFKHDGHRWHRHYYSYLVGGLWYWYWYDVIADQEPAALVYPVYVLPECDLDDDECTEPGLIAPALLEGRATQEAIDQCAAEFPSFDPETGTYEAADGVMRVCPYLE